MINKKKIKLIAPKRKNQKTKNTKREKKLLSKRSGAIENAFANTKKHERVMVRKDKKISTYISFVYLSLFDNFCKFNF